MSRVKPVKLSPTEKRLGEKPAEELPLPRSKEQKRKSTEVVAGCGFFLTLQRLTLKSKDWNQNNVDHGDRKTSEG